MRGLVARLRPDVAQAAILYRQGQSVSWLHNQLLGDYQRRYASWLEGTTWECDTEAGKPQIDRIGLIKAAGELARTTPFLGRIHSQVAQQVGLHLFNAFTGFFTGRTGYPVFAKKRNGWSMTFPQVKPKQCTERGVVIPLVGLVSWDHGRRLDEFIGNDRTPKSMTVSFDGDRFHVAVTVESSYVQPLAPVGEPVAFDRGIVETLAGSDGSSLVVRTATARERRRLRRQARSISRKHKRSQRRSRAVTQRRRTQRRIQRRVHHDIHVFTTRTAKTKPVVVVERLNLMNMSRSAAGTIEEPGVHVRAKSGLNRELHASCLGLIVRQLAYKCLWHGGRLFEVPAAGSSQTCRACGHRDRKNRHGKQFRCLACGHMNDADHNAAHVLLQRYQSGLGSDITAVPVEGRKRAWRHRRAQRPGDISAGEGTSGSGTTAESLATMTTGGNALALGSSALEDRVTSPNSTEGDT